MILVHTVQKQAETTGMGQKQGYSLGVLLTARGLRDPSGGGHILHLDLAVVMFIQSINTQHMVPASPMGVW